MTQLAIFSKAVLAATIVVFAACDHASSADSGDKKIKEEIGRALDLREQALELGDVEMYKSVISADYGGEPEQRQQLIDRLSNDIAAFDGIEYTLLSRSIYLEGKERAKVVQTFRLQANLGGAQKGYSGTEEFDLVREAGVWKIVGGL